MAGKQYESLHILSLVINRRQDIPLVRSKTKLLARAAGCSRLTVTQLSTCASELSRLLRRRYGGGMVKLSIVRSLEQRPLTGIELIFEGRRSCIPAEEEDEAGGVDSCPATYEDFIALPPVRGARRVLDEVHLVRGLKGLPVQIRCLKWGPAMDWEQFEDIEAKIRKELFSDIEESYIENLKVKHDEVLKLLKEKSMRTRELDRVNADLFRLSRNLEDLAQERTMVEMSLRIADRVRNPATVIGGITNLLLSKSCQSAKEKSRLEALREQARKLEEAVRDFDDLVTRTKKLFCQEDLHELVCESVSLCSSLSRKKIRTTITDPAEKVTAQVNRATLKIALLNIFRYVAGLSALGGELIIKVLQTEHHPCLSLTFQRERASSPGQKGEPQVTLELARQIVAEHQGELQLLSGAEETGMLTIQICFPLYWQEKISF